MNNSPLFTIVMPIYNMEKFLATAIESVLIQTYENFELILVNDCSTDSSRNICDSYAKFDTRVTSVHLTKNRGLSFVRNIGVEHASGQYVLFMDSDDTIEKELLMNVKIAIGNRIPNAIMFGFIEDYYDSDLNLKNSYNVVYNSMMLLNQDDLRKEIIHIENSTLFGYSCDKFYNLEYLRSSNVKFENIRLIEDYLFNLAFFENADSLIVIDYPGYHYNKRINESLTGKFVPEYFDLQVIRVSSMLSQYKKWDLCNEEVKHLLADIYVRYIFSALQRNCDHRSHMNLINRYRWLINLYHQDLYNELINFASSKSFIVNAMCIALKSKSSLIILLFGKIIFIIKNNLPILFSKLKQNR